MADSEDLRGKLPEQNGVILPLVAGALIMLIAFMGLAVDIGFLMVARNKLQNVADASALAGCRLLGVSYEGMTYADQQAYVADPEPIITRAKTAALYNEVARKSIELADNEVEIGDWDGLTKTFTPTLDQPNAVRVTAHRDDFLNGKIPTFFARIMGIKYMGSKAQATAALTGISTMGEGALPIPVGISKYWFDNPPFCNQPIKFYPTGTIEGCAGWHVYDGGNPNDAKLRNILKGLLDTAKEIPGGYSSPEAKSYESIFDFTGGTQSQLTFNDFLALFGYCKQLNDYKIDFDDNSNTWTTSVPVYNWDNCDNPNKPILIVGFATVVIDNVKPAPDKTISGYVICERIDGGRGSGGDYGTLGSIPGLVQ